MSNDTKALADRLDQWADSRTFESIHGEAHDVPKQLRTRLLRAAARALRASSGEPEQGTARCQAQKANDTQREWLCDLPAGHDGPHKASRVRTVDGDTAPWGTVWANEERVVGKW